MARKLSSEGRRTLKLLVSEMTASAREAFEWTDKQWAKRAGVHPSTITRITSGTTRFPTFETLVRMANAAHLDIVSEEKGMVKLRIQGTQRETKVGQLV